MTLRGLSKLAKYPCAKLRVLIICESHSRRSKSFNAVESTMSINTQKPAVVSKAAILLWTFGSLGSRRIRQGAAIRSSSPIKYEKEWSWRDQLWNFAHPSPRETVRRSGSDKQGRRPV